MAGQHTPETVSKEERPPLNGTAPPPEWMKWLTERGAAKQMGTSQSYLRRLLVRAELEPFRAPDGTNRYSPALIATASKLAETVQELADDDDAPATAPKANEQGLLYTMSQALKQARDHEARLLNIICGPVERMLSHYDEHQARLEARLGTLESARDASQKAREEQLAEMHDRELETAIVKSSLERKDKLFGQLEKRMPLIFDKLEQSFLLGNKNVSAATGATLGFLKTLEPVQVMALLNPDVTILTPEQQALVRKIFEEAGIPVPSSPEQQPPEERK